MTEGPDFQLGKLEPENIMLSFIVLVSVPSLILS
jgi:hypothetical protein